MEQVRNVWSNLGGQKRVVVALASVAMFAAILGVARLASTPSLSLLYSGLESGAAGEVVSALEARGVDYAVRGDSILVDAAQRDALRMTLAGEGLPSSSTQGYELLDQMTGFGTTSQMFDAAYWRAKEGELARTIVSSPAIQSARVHISNPGTKPFQREVRPTASVTVTPAGGGIGATHARALRYLVASAISGLDPEDVSIIDANGGVVLAGSDDDGPQSDSSDRAAELKRNVERLLEARVGYGNAVVEVNVETVTDREQITERRIDPDSRTAISTERTETSNVSNDQGGGDVTVASNLPDGDAAAGGETSMSENTEKRERTNFEISETQREILRSPGAVARITTAVLVDGLTAPGPDGTPVWSARPPEEMAALRELVAAAVGFREDRGDALSLQSMQFEALPDAGTGPGGAAALRAPLDMMRLIQIGILALVSLVIGLFVVRPILTAKPQADALPAPDAARLAALEGEIDPDDTPRALTEIASAPGTTPDGAGAVDRLRALIDARQDESVQILRSWMEADQEEKA